MLEPAFHLPQSSVILGIGFDREWEFVVCLPTFNHEKYIEDAIVSVLAQDVGEIAHVFIFDDASTD